MLKFLSHNYIHHKKVLLRVDFNVSLNNQHKISDDTRIQQALPTIKLLLKEQNKIILVSHLGEPQKSDPQFSLQRVAQDLATYLPNYKVHLVKDFQQDNTVLLNQKPGEILLLENIRFYPGEKANAESFAKKLAGLADIYVNDAFAVSHRQDASIVGVPHFLPSYAGLLMEKEMDVLDKVIQHPDRPFVAILGGSKITTKIKLIHKLISLADTILIGGGLANTLLAAENIKIGESLVENDEIAEAKKLLHEAKTANKNLLLPLDAIVRDQPNHEAKIEEVKEHESIMDIGPETQAIFGQHIATAKTIIWNGPVGKFEDPEFSRGTEFIYYAITQNNQAFSVVGGGDTLAAMKNKDYRDKISHISTGGGAMLGYIENGTLPGIEALK